MRADALPDFDSLPGEGCAWGLFDKSGQRDNLGTLNLLTPEVVLVAKDEIKVGISVSVNWPITEIARPGFGRKPPEHNIIDWRPKTGRPVHDDELSFNTQSGSQWDGFKHVGHPKTFKYYNNLDHEQVKSTLDNGIHHWNERGGIVGRGVLLDYVRYAAKNGIRYEVMSRHPITVAAMEDMARDQGTELRPGDILIVRSGFTKWYQGATNEERDSKIQGERDKLARTGVEASKESAAWLWNHHFAAVAGDSISFEQWPYSPECTLHMYLLSQWGCPIGEMFDLEKLSVVCEEQKRWSFFFTSAPLNTPGGVASPPNALCIF